ncbi:Uncharacterised protein [Mycobacterium tuberculosis]|nr:Uncharacterised protein [Mycobacterium tuberculosis]CKZ75322.1 Uncharacterised protein [Mycobacterium tuberculosis]
MPPLAAGVTGVARPGLTAFTPAAPAPPMPPLPPLPNNSPPSPPACPVPGAPLAPLPISGRPNSAWAGALTAASMFGPALAASALAYAPASTVRVRTTWA